MAHVHHRVVRLCVLCIMTIRNDASTLLAVKAGKMLAGRSRGSCVWGFRPFLAALSLGRNEPKLHANLTSTNLSDAACSQHAPFSQA